MDDRLVMTPCDSRAWRNLPPVLRGHGLVLRETEHGDALSLFTVLTDPQIAPTLAQVPQTPAALADLIGAAALERRHGRAIWFTIVPDSGAVAGVFRMREIEPEFKSADCEFVVAREQWGSGLFVRAASLAIDFVFDGLGASRLETRVAVRNGRAQAALRKLGAVQEAVLRQSVRLDNVVCDDQALLTLFADDWRAGRDTVGKIH
jgi:RimJ/RimL family protein N-acetyltransferase